MRHKILILTYFILAVWNCRAQQVSSIPDYISTHFPQDKDGNKGWINKIVEDQDGLFWLACVDGLFSFDGIQFKQYKNNPLDASSISDSNFEDLAIDSSGFLWLTTNSGITRFNTKTEEAKHYKDPIYPFKNNSTNRIFIDSDETIWVSSFQNGLTKFHVNPEKSIHIDMPEPSYIDNFSWTNNIHIIKDDPYTENALLLATSNQIIRLSKTSLETEIIHEFKPDIFYNDDISILYPLSKARFIVGTWEIDLAILDTSNPTSTIEEIKIPDEFQQNDHKVFSDVLKVETNKYWISSWRTGIFELNIEADTITIVSRNNEPLGLYEESNMGLYQREIGEIISFGTTITNYYKNPLKGKYFKLPSVNNQAPSIERIKYNHKSQMFQVTGLNTLIRFKDHDSIQKWSAFPGTSQNIKTQSLLNQAIDSSGNTIILSHPNTGSHATLYKINENFTSTSIIRINHKDFPKLQAISALEIDPLTNHLFIGTEEHGLFVYNFTTKETKKLFNDIPNNNLVNDITSIACTENNIWIGTKGGIIKYSKSSNKPTHYTNDINNKNSINGNEVDQIIQLSNGDMFCVLKEKGINIFPESKGPDHCKIFINRLNDQYLTYNFKPIEFDNKVWLATNYELSIINTDQYAMEYIPRRNIKLDYKFTNSLAKGSNSLYLGNGSTILQLNPLSTESIVDSFSIKFNSIKKDKTTLFSGHRNINNKKFHFSYMENQLSINAFVSDYYRPIEIEAYYKLEGLETNWNKLRSDVPCYYQSIPPGSYTFKIQAKRSGDHSYITKQFDIIIAKPYYNEWWFYLLIFIAAGAIIFGIFRYKVNQIKKEQQLKSEYEGKLKEMEMQALRSQMNPHFLFNSLNSIKYYVIKEDQRKAAKYIDTFSKLIRLILQNSRKQLISLSEELKALELYINVEQHRFENSFEYSLNVEENIDLDYFEIPPLLIQPFVENAIWHGLQPKEEAGKLDISVTREKESLEIIIQDNGIGRIKSKKIAENKLSHSESLGMKLTKDRMNISESMYNLQIEVDIKDLFHNRKNCGTKVSIRINPKTTKL